MLGPILFLFYINDLTTVDVSGRFTLFADDTTLVWRSSDTTRLIACIERDLFMIKSWCDSNLLCFNMSKTSVVSFNCNVSNISLTNESINIRSNVKFLGLYVDENLKFSAHIESLSRKVSSGCYAVRICASELGAREARMVYFALVESHLLYGNAFWGCCSRQLFMSVFVLQKRAIRYICRAGSREHCKPLFVRHQILTLVCLFVLETACLVHKNVLLNPAPVRSAYNTRRSGNLPLPIPKTTQTKQSIIYEGRKIYNHVPETLKNLQCLKKFKRNFKQLLLIQAFYTPEEYYGHMF